MKIRSYVFLSAIILLLSVAYYMKIGSSYRADYFRLIADNVRSSCDDPNDINCLIDNTLRISGDIQDVSKKYLKGRKFNTIQYKITPLSMMAKEYGHGDCGAYAAHFIAVMNALGKPTNFVIQNTSYGPNSHITAAVKYNGKLLLADPLNKHYFADTNGIAQDINEVSKNWQQQYANRVPEWYDTAYNYQQGWMYTNWRKYGGIKWFVQLLVGKNEIDTFSLRYYHIKYDNILWRIPFLGAFLLSLIWFWLVARKKKRLQPSK